MTASPLGKFAEVAAFVVAIGVIVAWLASVAGLFPKDDTLTALAAGAVGLLLGQRATTNGAAHVAVAAHKRLDKIHAPPAEDLIA